jgi:dihydropteroate synthase
MKNYFDPQVPEYIFNSKRLSLHYPAVMGILNLTPDSFSDGGNYIEPSAAVEKALQMVEQGAQIIDLGGESTRPGSFPISEEEEIQRVIPILSKLPPDQFVISIDTTKPKVAELALEAGAHLINDISGGDPDLLKHAQAHNAGFILMHSQGKPKSMQEQPSYMNPVSEIRNFFDQKKDQIKKLGLPRVWIDPGIGFGKTLAHNLELMRNLADFQDQDWGILLGSSRKSWIDHLCDAPIPSQRLGGSIASALDAVAKGVEIIRVHDVKETVQAIEVAKELATN